MHYTKTAIFQVIIYFSVLLTMSSYAYIVIDEKFYASIAIFTSAVIALSVALLGIHFQRKTAQESNSLDFQISLANNDKYLESLAVIVLAINNREKVPVENFAREEFSTSKEAEAIRYVLNTWERAANAILHGIYDEKYLYRTYKSMLLYFGVNLRVYIREKQKEGNSFFSSLNWLIIKCSIRRDSFEENMTKQALEDVFKLLDNVKHGKIPNKLK